VDDDGAAYLAVSATTSAFAVTFCFPGTNVLSSLLSIPCSLFAALGAFSAFCTSIRAFVWVAVGVGR